MNIYNCICSKIPESSRFKKKASLAKVRSDGHWCAKAKLLLTPSITSSPTLTPAPSTKVAPAQPAQPAPQGPTSFSNNDDSSYYCLRECPNYQYKLAKNGALQCLSTNGKDCSNAVCRYNCASQGRAPPLGSVALDVASVAARNGNSKDLPSCAAAVDYVNHEVKSSQWYCIPGLGSPMRLGPSGNAECMSLDSKDCEWSDDAQGCINQLASPTPNPYNYPVVCSSADQAKAGHWCNTVKTYLSNQPAPVAPVPANVAYPTISSDPIMNQVLYQTNVIRASYGLSTISWDASLAVDMQKWASSCPGYIHGEPKGFQNLAQIPKALAISASTRRVA
ncbi:Aste57867_16644 [Aphanomyces stellatus]|uniref:Aste57867_16644 protein n=1 Tax=Aphanomyces stellatus TaxID=120398 RepID=A0A485L5Y5_9STRA|nr:hypothetical protein As57867_016587 [Aphanomyces stellatus]VFT93415.1 Aste57867_16644 [Aphanomyces stellatus]